MADVSLGGSMALCKWCNLHDNYDPAPFDLLRPAVWGAGGNKGHSTPLLRMLTTRSHVLSATDYRAKEQNCGIRG